MDDNNTRSIRIMKGNNHKQRYMKLYQKCSDNFKSYLHLYKNSVRLVIREPQNSFYSVNKVKANDFINGHHNVVSDSVSLRGKPAKKKNLTPLPYKSTKRVSSSKEQKDLKSLERNAVVMRMIEYAQHINSNKHVRSKYTNKVDSIIYIQKILRGFVFRKAFRGVLLLYSKLQLFITHIKNYSLIKANHVQKKKQNAHKVSNTRNYVYNFRNISPCITSNSNKSVSKPSHSKSRYNNKIKLVKNINKFLSSNSVNHTHQPVKPVSKIPTNKINKTYSNNKCLRFNKPPKKPPYNSKLHINTTNSNSNSVLANYLNNCASNATEAYTPLNVTTNPTSKSTNRLNKHKYSQHNCVSFVVFPTKYVNSIGVQTVITSDESETDNAHYSLNVTGNNSIIVNNPFNTYQNNSCLMSKQYKECLHFSHLGGVKGYNNSLRVTQDKSLEIDYDVKKHNGMMMSYNLVSKINSIEFEYLPEVNVDKSTTNHKEMNLSQLSIECNNNTLNRVIRIKQLPKELSDNSYTKLTLHSEIHDIVASKIILIQSSVRKYLLRNFNSTGHEVDNGIFISKRNIHLHSCYVTKVLKADLTKQLNVIETAVKGMLCKKGFYNNKKDPTLLAVALLIVKRFSFSVKFYSFRLLRRKYCYNAFPSESMNTIQDDYDLNDERCKKLNCLFNEVIFDLKKDNIKNVNENVIESNEVFKPEVNNTLIVIGQKSE